MAWAPGTMMSVERCIPYTGHEGKCPAFPDLSGLHALFIIFLLTVGASLQAQDLEESIWYHSRDSTRYDLANRRVLLFGGATVKYGDIELTADRIVLDMRNEEVMAHGTSDSTGAAIGLPHFVQDGRTIEADSIRYNFRTKSGFVQSVRTTEQQLHALARTSKMHANKEVHSLGGMLTTCDRPHPHYHFAVSRMMVIPDDKIVAGPALMKFGRIPTPIAVPFGLFPNRKGGAAGLLIPTWGNSDQMGYFLLNGGYYLPIGDNFDESLTADIYSRGSWGVRSVTRYKRRYHYSGSMDLQYNNKRTSIPEYPDFAEQRTFFVRWNHLMDPKASLTDRFNASVNLGSSQNFTNTLNSSTTDYLSNTFQSNVSWNHLWLGKPYSLTVAMRHSQNTLNRTFNITLPSVGFNLQRIFPTTFFGGDRQGRSLWYDRIGVTWNSMFDNQLNTTEDKLALNNLPGLLREMRNGMRHTGAISTSFKTRFFTLNPQVNVVDRTYFSYLDKSYDAASDIVRTDTLPGVRNLFDWNASATLTSKLYGMYTFLGNGRLRAIRHVLTPTASLTYVPGNDTRVQGPFGTSGAWTSYSPYEQGIYGIPSPNESGNVGLGLVQSLEGKVRSKEVDADGDLVLKKVKLLDYFGINANYDLLKDSVRWSPVSMAARTQLLNKVDVNLSSAWDPYATDSLGRNIDRSTRDLYGSLAHLRNATLALGFDIKSKRYGQAVSNSATNARTDDQVVGEADPSKGAPTDFNIPWMLRLNYSYSVTRNWTERQYREVRTQSVLATGDVTLFKYWKLGVSSGYDLEARQWTPTSLNLYWDLHCWEFNLNVIPLGIRQSFSVRINVKASVLRDLKYELRKPFGRSDNLLY